MTSRTKAVFGIILIFVLGVVSGAVGTSIFVKWKMAEFLKHPGVALMAAMEQRLTKNLDLDAGQTQQIHGYFMDNLRQHKLLQSQIQPQVQQLNQATVQEIRAALRPDQQTRFNQNLTDLQSRFWNYTTNQDLGNESAPEAQPNVGSTNSGPSSPPATQ